MSREALSVSKVDLRRGEDDDGDDDDGVCQLRTRGLQLPTAGGRQKLASSCHADYHGFNCGECLISDKNQVCHCRVGTEA